MNVLNGRLCCVIFSLAFMLLFPVVDCSMAEDQGASEEEGWKKEYTEVLEGMMEAVEKLEGMLADTRRELDKTREELLKEKRLTNKLLEKTYEMTVQLERLEARHRALMEEKAGGAESNAAGDVLEGIITDVDDEGGLAVISIGATDGVKKGGSFHVTRGGNFVCDIVIVDVEPERAGGVLELMVDTPKAGDKVVSQFLSSAKVKTGETAKSQDRGGSAGGVIVVGPKEEGAIVSDKVSSEGQLKTDVDEKPVRDELADLQEMFDLCKYSEILKIDDSALKDHDLHERLVQYKLMTYSLTCSPEGLDYADAKIKAFPDMLIVKVVRGIFLLRSGKLKEFESVRSELEGAKPSSYGDRIAMASWYHFRGDSSRTMGNYTSAIEAEPENYLGYLYRGAFLAQTGEYGKADEDIDKCLSLNKDCLMAYIVKATICNNTNKPHFARRHLDSASKLNPDAGIVFGLKGECELVSKNNAAAFNHFNKAITLSPWLSNVYVNRGILYKTHKNDINRAIKDYQKAIELDPLCYMAHYNLGVSRRAQNNFHGAIDEYTKAIEINPKHVASYHSRAFAYYKLGQRSRASSDWLKAYNLDPYGQIGLSAKRNYDRNK